jgi:hypothetical protein
MTADTALRGAAAGVAFWAVGHYQLVDQAKMALGL